jgi:rhodanese-related sulfurtransferase
MRKCDVVDVYRFCIENKAVILDIRSCEHFSERYSDVPKVYHIPMDELDDKWVVLPVNKKIYLMNNDVEAIVRVFDFLDSHDFDIEIVDGGFLEWCKRDLPIVDMRSVSFCNNICECACKKM